jgi:DNA-binding response OmpR family regulator
MEVAPSLDRFPCYTPSTSRTILIVDDSELLRRAFRAMIIIDGRFMPFTCPSPTDAARLLSERRFDLVLSDLVFDNDTPKAAAGMMRLAIEKGSSLIISSGGHWDKRPEFENTIFIQKPVNLSELMAAIAGAMQSHPVPSITPKEIDHLTHPEWHIMTPVQKHLANSISRGDKDGLLMLYREFLRKDIMRGDSFFSKRQLEHLMESYEKTGAKLKR